jgi:hypothetical protein
MRSRKKNFGLAVVATCAIAAIAVPVVQAITTDTGDGLGINVSSKLKPNTVTTFSATIATVPVTLTCTSASTSFVASTTSPALGPVNVSNPVFTGCTDSLGGTDTVKSNSTNGRWTATFVDGPNDETTEATAADQIKIGIPKAGQTVTSSKFANCTITVAPSAAASVPGAYDDKGTLTITNQPVMFSTSALCPGGAATGTAHFSTALKSGGTGTPGFAVTPPIFDVS